MTIVAIDDTDSRSDGMCTTYAGALLSERLEAAGSHVDRHFLMRLNPAIDRKTRGNAAVAIETDADIDTAFHIATEIVSDFAIDAPDTSPGIVAFPGSVASVPPVIESFGRRALREVHTITRAKELATEWDCRHGTIGDDVGYGRIGALAAIGLAGATHDRTYEYLAYRKFERCGTPRSVDTESVINAARTWYPRVWDTVDRTCDEVVCVPNAPGPVLFGIRGEDAFACRSAGEMIAGEAIDRSITYETNQGTDVHLAPGEIGHLREGAGYRLDAIVTGSPTTRRGGHVFLEVSHPIDMERPGSTPSVACIAFAPTQHFKDHVRSLRVGDRVTVAGEYANGAIKLEKFAARALVRYEEQVPTCRGCGRSMKSAGHGQGYRCRDCDTTAPGRVRRPIDRSLTNAWYEVPPCARRHVAKPLIRGGFDAQTVPER